MTRLPNPADLPDRPPLIHVGPLPPCRNGIADYAATLLPRLAQHYQCLCVVADVRAVDARIRAVAQVLSYAEYAVVADRLAGERHLCHLGNNTDHVPVLDLLARTPATVVLHDLTLHYLMERWAAASLGGAAQVQHVVRLLHGAPTAGLVAAKFNGGVPLQAIYAEADCLGFLEGTARGVITHSHHGALRVRAQGYSGPVSVIPHFAEPPPEAVCARLRRDWRRRLGLAETTLLFASLGFVMPNKQIPLALRELAALPPESGDWRYVIAGETRDPQLDETLRRLGLGSRVIRLDYLAEAEFDGLLAAADLLVNLRFPTSGETSGTVCRALAQGVPVLVTDHGWYRELPDAVSYKLPAGPESGPALRALLLMVLLDPELRLQKAAAAREHARGHLTLDRVTAAYCQAIEDGHALRLPPAPAAPVLLTQKPSLVSPAAAPGGLAALLQAVFEAERVSTEAGPLCPLRLPGGPDLDMGLADPASRSAEAGPGPRQLFALREIDDTVGGLLGAVQDAWQRLEVGDVFTLALVSRTPDGPVRSDRLLPLGPHLPQGPLALWLEEALTAAGFVLLRQTELLVPPATVAEDYARLLVATARKASISPPELAWLREIA